MFIDARSVMLGVAFGGASVLLAQCWLDEPLPAGVRPAEVSASTPAPAAPRVAPNPVPNPPASTAASSAKGAAVPGGVPSLGGLPSPGGQPSPGGPPAPGGTTAPTPGAASAQPVPPAAVTPGPQGVAQPAGVASAAAAVASTLVQEERIVSAGGAAVGLGAAAAARARLRAPGDLLQDLQAEARDDPWASQTEGAIRAYLQVNAPVPAFEVLGVECRQTMCKVQAHGRSDAWDAVVKAMSTEPWAAFAGHSTSSTPTNGRLALLTVFTRNP